jgi:predicted RNA binding protein with dsRBD fold (UPF0201 family)
MEEITVRVETEISPTESEEKVKQAVANIFGNVPTETKQAHKGSVLMGEAKGQQALVKLRDLLRAERIRSAARKAFFVGTSGRNIRFCLNKQVAFAGHVSFSEEVAESPLGPLRVTIECGNPRELVDWLAPRTA